MSRHPAHHPVHHPATAEQLVWRALLGLMLLVGLWTVLVSVGAA